MPDSNGPSALRRALAEKLRSLRQKRGVTQEALAFEAHLHPTYISMLENGRKSPTIDVLDRVARALHAKASQILASAERTIRDQGSHAKAP